MISPLSLKYVFNLLPSGVSYLFNYQKSFLQMKKHLIFSAAIVLLALVSTAATAQNTRYLEVRNLTRLTPFTQPQGFAMEDTVAYAFELFVSDSAGFFGGDTTITLQPGESILINGQARDSTLNNPGGTFIMDSISPNMPLTISPTIGVIDTADVILSTSSNFAVGGGNVIVVWPTGPQIETLPSDTVVSDLIPIVEVASLNNPVQHNWADLNVYPNPAAEVLNLQTDRPVQRLSLRNASGQVVKQVQQQQKIRIAGLPPGTYFLEVWLQDAKQPRYLRFIKAHR